MQAFQERRVDARFHPDSGDALARGAAHWNLVLFISICMSVVGVGLLVGVGLGAVGFLTILYNFWLITLGIFLAVTGFIGSSCYCLQKQQSWGVVVIVHMQPQTDADGEEGGVKKKEGGLDMTSA